MKIRGETHYLWRAVDHAGEGLEACVTKRHDKSAGFKLLRKAMKRYDNPEVIVTDKCPSYHAAMKLIGFKSLRHAALRAWRELLIV